MKKAKKPTPKRRPGSKRPKRHQGPTSILSTAVLVGCSRQALEGWLAQGAPGKRADGTYDVEAIRQWRVERGDRRTAKSGGVQVAEGEEPLEIRIDRATAELKELQGQKVQLDLDAARGLYIPKADVEKREAARMAYLRWAFFTDLSKLALNCAMKEVALVEAILRAKFEGWCREWSETI